MEASDASDSDTIHGVDTDTGTETESAASSYASMKNKKKKEKKKKAAAARKAAAAEAAVQAASTSGSNGSAGPSSDVVVEYITSRNELQDPAFAELADIFGHFSTAEQLTNGTDAAGGAAGGADASGTEAASASGGAAANAAADGEEEDAALSRRRKKQMKRLSIAELKQLVTKPEVVEAWDVTSDDPRLLVHLKSYRNSIPVPKHWCQKRKFLMGKRGVEKPPFKLPDFIAATGIEKIRASVLEKENAKKLKGKMKEKMQPKLGKIDIDYQVLHDAFFKFQSKPYLTKHGDVYYEGKEHEAALREKRPGVISAELSAALEIPTGGPPPWLVNMQRYGPPPSYGSLKIPGLNAPIPEGTSYGFHAGGWGKPPVDEFGRPLYGDVFGTAEKESAEVFEAGLSKESWGAMEDDEEDDDEEEYEEDGTALEGSEVTEDDIAAGISSVTSTTPSGLATPDAVMLRKTMADGVGTPSALSTATGGADTPESSQPQLFQVLQQTDAKVGNAAFGSSHGYVVPPPSSVPPVPSSSSSGKRKGAVAGGVELALDPAELEHLDEGALKARYEQMHAAQKEASAPEDVSDIIEEQERKRKRKLEAQRGGDKRGGR